MSDHAHSAPHDHDSHSGHAHNHAPESFGAAFAIGITLNRVFVIVEGVYGYIGNSTALVADAGHNLGDVFGFWSPEAPRFLPSEAPKGTLGLVVMVAVDNRRGSHRTHGEPATMAVVKQRGEDRRTRKMRQAAVNRARSRHQRGSAAIADHGAWSAIGDRPSGLLRSGRPEHLATYLR